MCAKRSEKMIHPGKWEFPRGKIEDQEIPKEALHRELQEELGVEVCNLQFFEASLYQFEPGSTIFLFAYSCELTMGTPIAKETQRTAMAATRRVGYAGLGSSS